MDMLGRKFQCMFCPTFCLQQCSPATDKQAKEQVGGMHGPESAVSSTSSLKAELGSHQCLGVCKSQCVQAGRDHAGSIADRFARCELKTPSHNPGARDSIRHRLPLRLPLLPLRLLRD